MNRMVLLWLLAFALCLTSAVIASVMPHYYHWVWFSLMFAFVAAIFSVLEWEDQ